MKKTNRHQIDKRSALPVPDSPSMKGGSRGKYDRKVPRGTKPVLLAIAEVAKAFPSDAAPSIRPLVQWQSMTKVVRFPNKALTRTAKRPASPFRETKDDVCSVQDCTRSYSVFLPLLFWEIPWEESRERW